MNLVDLFSLGDKYNREGNVQMALNVWNDVLKQELNQSVFAATHINLADTYKKLGNPQAELKELTAFLNSSQSAVTLKMVPNAEARIQELQKQLTPQPAPVQVPQQSQK